MYFLVLLTIFFSFFSSFQLCEEGKFRTLSIAAPLSCYECPAGFVQKSQGANSCNMCLPGKYANVAGKSSCTQCRKERWRSEEKDIILFTLEITPQIITESVGVTVTQGTVTGTLKTALVGAGVTSVVIETISGITFDTAADLIIGSSTVLLANINAATESRPARLSASSCFDCPTGYTTNGGKGSSSCGICGAGKYGTGCKLCEVGTFRSTDATIESPLTCRDCPSGFFQVSSGQATCIPCSPGKSQSLKRSSKCLFCPKRTTLSPGYYGKDSAMSECKECENGKQAVEDGSTFCSICMAGTYGRHCSACVPGKYRSPTDYDSTQCIECNSGYYQPETFQASCLPCSPGLFQDVPGSAECQNCPNGKFAHALKSSTCAKCPGGTGTVKNGSAFCIDCGGGRHAPDKGNGICQDCEEMFFQSEPGQATCEACPNGQLSKRAAFECELPAVVDPALFPSPEPPSLSIVAGNPKAVQIHWSYTPIQEKPDGFYVRIGTTRDFSDEIVQPAINGGDSTSTVVVIDEATALWLLELPIYMQVQAFKKAAADGSVSAFSSEWSTVTDPWTLAHKCDNDEFLSTNHTSPNSWICVKCPDGASCLGPTVWEDVRPLKGFWRVPWNNSIFERCPFVDDCKGFDLEKRLDNQTDPRTDGKYAGVFFASRTSNKVDTAKFPYTNFFFNIFF